MPPMLMLRADASTAIGTGHVMRCLALAQAWRDLGGQAMLAAAELPPALVGCWAEEGVEVVRLSAPPGSDADAAATVDMARRRRAAWVVADGYRLGPAFQSAVRAAGLRLMVVDDHGHHARHCADMVLDQNLGATPERYPHTGGARLLLGTRWTLLRRDIARAAAVARPAAAAVEHIVVTLGGAGRPGLAERIADALAPLSLHATLVLGTAHPDAEAVRRHAQARGLEVRVAVRDMGAVLAGADLVIAAAGSTVYEIAALGLPALVVSIADDHPSFVAALAAAGLVVDLGPHATLTAERLGEEVTALAASVPRRRALSEAGRRLVDGRGASRVAKEMLADVATLRPAVLGDAAQIFEWANEEGARAGSFSSKLIEWDEHVAWLEQRLADPASRVLIIEIDGRPLGYLRFDLEGKDAVASITLSPEGRGLGLAGRVTVRAFDDLRRTVGVERAHAYVRPENLPSAATLERAGFRSLGETTIKGNQALHYMFEGDTP